MTRKIGFIDYYIDEWHANHYPQWIRERSKALGLHWEVAYVWAEIDRADGMTTQQWCEKEKVQHVSSIEELIELSNAIIILSPDHPEHHERLAKQALQSGKPVYIDKTFAPDLAAAKRLFQYAEVGNTPLFSSSALRYALEIQQLANPQTINKIEHVAVAGPGQYSNYAVHQFEMIVTLMGINAKRIKSHSTSQCRQLIIEYEQGRKASFLQMEQAPFQATLSYRGGAGEHVSEVSDMFPQLIDHILCFFEDRQPPVKPEETLAVIALVEAGEEALLRNDEWVEVKR